MTQIRKLKKSESLEIRLPHPTKQAFMAHCQAEGRSASEALRGFIDAQISPRPRTAKRRLRYLVVGGLAAAALGAVAAPSLARPVAASEQFRTIDANGDGAIEATEFARLDADGDHRISLAEFTQAAARRGRP